MACEEGVRRGGLKADGLMRVQGMSSAMCASGLSDVHGVCAVGACKRAAEGLNRPLLSTLMLALAVAACALALSISLLPQQACALETVKCTARPNADVGSDVLGGMETRITWEGQAAADESVSKVSLTLPADTSFSTDDARLTVLSGADLMTRENVPVSFSSEGQTITASLEEPSNPGAYLRIEVYEVSFPVTGGSMSIGGAIERSDGTTEALDVPPIEVVGISLTKQITTYLEGQDWVQQWNSNKLLRLFFNPPILVSSVPIVFQGFLFALAIVLVSFPIAIPIGLLLAFMRMSRFAILRGLGSFYVNVVRGTPTFLQIYIAFFGLPLADIQIPHFLLGVLVLSFNSAAYQCEIFRAGIQSISKGQFEAARSLGMNGAQTMLFVIIPQTVRRVLPTLTNEFILLYKDTSLLAAVGIMEVVMYAKTIVASTGSITPYIVAAGFYLVVTLPLAKFVGMLEAKLAGADSGSAAPKSRKGKRRRSASDKGQGVMKRGLGHVEDGGNVDVSVSPERFSSM